MSADLEWHDGDFASAYKLNRISTHKMPGTSIASLLSTDIEPGWIIYCDVTGGGFTANNLYQRNEDNTAWDIIGLKGHTHIDDASGGAMGEINIANLGIGGQFELNKRFARANAFYQTIVTSGTVTDDSTTGRIVLQSGTTSGGSATISDGGSRRPDFSQPMAFEVTLNVTSSTNFQVKLGVGAEDINAGNLTPVKFGIEGCSSSGVNWLFFSSDGTTRSTLATSEPVVAGHQTYRLELDPGTEIRFYKSASTLIATKTTNVPATGTTDFHDIFRAGIKNSATENKQLQLHGLHIVGTNA